MTKTQTIHKLIGMTWDGKSLCGSVVMLNGENVTAVTSDDSRVTCASCKGKLGIVPKPQRHQTPKQQAYLFFLKHAGYSVAQGETRRQGRSRSARELAKAERDARALGFEFVWRDDWHIGSHLAEYDTYTEEPSTCEECICYGPKGEVLASLGCVDDATREYRRVVEAELAEEALSAR